MALPICVSVAALLILPCRVESGVPREWPIKKMVFSSRSVGWIMGTHRLIQSTDGGWSWTDLTDHFKASAVTNKYLDEPFMIDIHAGESGEIWLLLIDQLYMSPDGGESWLLVLDSDDLERICGRCSLEQVGASKPDSLFVVARQYSLRNPEHPLKRPTTVNTQEWESVLLTIPRIATNTAQFTDQLTMAILPRGTRMISWDQRHDTLALSSESVFRLAGEDWVEIYRSESQLSRFAPAGTDIWIAAKGLFRLDALTGLADEVVSREGLAVDELLKVGQRRAVFRSFRVDRSGDLWVRRTRVQVWDRLTRELATTLLLDEMEVQGFFLDDDEGWLAVTPPHRSPANNAYCVLHTTDGGTAWKLVFKDENFPEDWLRRILEQEIVRD